MRELRLKYIIQMVSDIGARARDDEQALKMAHKGVQDALKKSAGEAGLLDRVLMRLGGVAGKSAADQAAYLSKVALGYQNLRMQAEGAAKAMQTAAKIGAGAVAGAYAADRLTRAPMEYGLRLAHMANTAYADRDVAGRVAGKSTLNAAISAATRTGGGTRDDAAGALDTLIASGAMSIDDAIKLLPTLMRGSTASGASAEQLGSIALRGMQSFGIQRDQVPELLNMAMAAGQAGGFELKDMARWLPQAMAAGRLSGLTGMEGMRRIMASMQAGVIVAGSKDEAGNNMVNLLAKINSNDTAKDFAKLGIDLPAVLASQREKGVNSLDAFVGLVDGIATKDPQYMALKAKLAKAGTQGERGETLQAMTDILQGKAVGQVVQDRQALMALVAEMNNRGYVQQVMDTTRRNTGAMGTSFGVVAQETAFARQQAANEAAIASTEAFGKVAPAMNAVFGTATELAREFPLLTTGVVGATGALVVFAAALGGSGLIGLLTGRAGNAGGVLGMAGTAVGGALATAGKWAGGVGLAGAAGYGVGTLFNKYLFEGTAAQDLLGRGIASTMAFFGNDEAKSAMGSMHAYEASARRNQQTQRWTGAPTMDFLGAPAPNLDAGLPAFLSQPGMKVGEGKLDVNVRLTDERATATTTVVQQPSLIRLNNGNTNPAGYTR